MSEEEPGTSTSWPAALVEIIFILALVAVCAICAGVIK